MAILPVDSVRIGKKFLRASFGMTKFCSIFLSKKKCRKEKCLFLHRSAEKGDVITTKDKVSQKVHIKMPKESIIDYCLNLGADEIWKYEQRMKRNAAANEEIRRNSSNTTDHWEGALPNVFGTISFIKRKFLERFGKTVEEMLQDNSNQQSTSSNATLHKSESKKKEKKAESKSTTSKFKSSVRKW